MSENNEFEEKEISKKETESNHKNIQGGQNSKMNENISGSKSQTEKKNEFAKEKLLTPKKKIETETSHKSEIKSDPISKSPNNKQKSEIKLPNNSKKNLNLESGISNKNSNASLETKQEPNKISEDNSNEKTEQKAEIPKIIPKEISNIKYNEKAENKTTEEISKSISNEASNKISNVKADEEKIKIAIPKNDPKDKKNNEKPQQPELQKNKDVLNKKNEKATIKLETQQKIKTEIPKTFDSEKQKNSNNQSDIPKFQPEIQNSVNDNDDLQNKGSNNEDIPVKISNEQINIINDIVKVEPNEITGRPEISTKKSEIKAEIINKISNKKPETKSPINKIFKKNENSNKKIKIASQQMNVISAFQKKPAVSSKALDAFNVKQSFQISLSKLAQNQTRERGFNEIKDLITKNPLQANLRIFLSILLAAKSDLPSEKEAHLLIISHICLIYKENLIDPLDKPSELRKTVLKIIEYIHSFFPDNRGVIQKICGKVLIDVYENCAKKLDSATQLVLIYGPLASYIGTKTEQNLINCSCFCLMEFVKYVTKEKNLEILDCLYKEIPQLFKKKPDCSADLIKSFSLLLEVEKNPLISEGKTLGYIEKLLLLISKTNKNLSISLKIESCVCIEKIAQILIDFPNEFQTLNNIDIIIENLYENTKDKDNFLKGASTKALNEWLKLIGYFHKDLQKYTAIMKSATPVIPKNNSAWRDLKNIRNLFKLNKHENAQVQLKEDPIPKNAVFSEIKNIYNFKKNEPSKILPETKKESDLKSKPSQPNLRNNSKSENLLDFQSNGQTNQPENNKIGKIRPVQNNFKRVLTVPISKYEEDNQDIQNEKENDNLDQKYSERAPLQNASKDNISQIKAANFQRKKMGLGGGHIPNNTQMENKLGLLKEMIRRSIEKRPQSADPIKRSQTFPKKQIKQETLPQFTQHEINEESYEKEVSHLIDPEKASFNSILTIKSQQGETKELFYRTTEKPKTIIRPPQNFENQLFQEINNKIEAELEKISQKPIRIENHHNFIVEKFQNKANISEMNHNLYKTGFQPWDQVLYCLGCSDVENAFNEILKSQDDIFLLRLMITTGPCYDDLTEKTSVKVLNKLLDFTQGNFIEKACCAFFQEAKQENLLNSLSLGDKTFLLKMINS